jgi:hypothetical protein
VFPTRALSTWGLVRLRWFEKFLTRFGVTSERNLQSHYLTGSSFCEFVSVKGVAGRLVGLEELGRRTVTIKRLVFFFLILIF